MSFTLLPILVLIMLLALIILQKPIAYFKYGGNYVLSRDYTKSPHVIVDALNLTHFFHKQITPEIIAKTIDDTAEIIHKHHKGNVIYVVKDRDSQFNNELVRKLYKQTSEKNKVTICVVERYVDPPSFNITNAHSSKGRDDFYMCILAAKYKCGIITADSLKDFQDFRSTIPPFHVLEFLFWKEFTEKEFIRPETYAKLHKPRNIHPKKYFSTYHFEIYKN